jgi:hypothetical protein
MGKRTNQAEEFSTTAPTQYPKLRRAVVEIHSLHSLSM